jgi:hypothetical protein
MLVRRLARGVATTISCSRLVSAAQTIDSVIIDARCTPIFITGEIQGFAEHATFADLLKTADPK